ncbi:MAG: protein kinase [Deltaproteobacteria bacterium]|nr:protein kinase [Deltaproteobacteria bacterium]
MAGQTTGALQVSIPSGTRLGRYEVITEIASGGMATVFLGRALGAAGFARLVAIKCLHPHVAKDEEFVGMFMDEARLAARIRHPNVVATLDLENGDDGLFLVMEFVEGEGLLGLLRAVFRERKRVPTPLALRIALDVLAGLHAAHELTGQNGEPLRLVHRDVSPHNILVGSDGISRITDFGIARAEERLSVTRDGQIKGKLSYMAPEQTSGTPVDRRADLWSVGVVVWECLAGRRLFFGQNDGEVLRNLLVHPIPRLRDLVQDIPAEIDAVIAKALARDPDDRYATASHFAEALEEAGGAIGIASTRAVGAFCRELASARIEALNAAARAAVGDNGTSSVRAVTRSRLPTDPERTAVRDEVPSLTALPDARTTSPPSAITSSVVPVQPATAQSRAVVPLVIIGSVCVALLAALGGIGLYVRGQRDGAARSQPSVTVTSPSVTPSVTPTAAPVTEPTVPVAESTADAGTSAEPETNMVISPESVAANTAPGAARNTHSHARTPSTPRPTTTTTGTRPPTTSNGQTFNPEAM